MSENCDNCFERKRLSEVQRENEQLKEAIHEQQQKHSQEYHRLVGAEKTLQADNNRLSQELNGANEMCGGLQENLEKLQAKMDLALLELWSYRGG